MSLFVIQGMSRARLSRNTYSQSAGDSYVELDSSSNDVDLKAFPYHSFTRPERPFQNKRFSLSSSAIPTIRKGQSSRPASVMENYVDRERDRHALPPSIIEKKHLAETSAAAQIGGWDDTRRPTSVAGLSRTATTVPARTSVDDAILGASSSQPCQHVADYDDASPSDKRSWLQDCIHEELKEAEAPQPPAMRRAHTSATAAGATRGEDVFGVGEISSDKRRASRRLSETVQGFGRKMKRRLSSMTAGLRRRDSIYEEPKIGSALVEQDVEGQCDERHTSRVTSPRRIHPTQVWSTPYNHGSLTDDHDNVTEEDAEPLLGGSRPLMVNNGFGQATPLQRGPFMLARAPTLVPVSSIQASGISFLPGHETPTRSEVAAPSRMLARLSIAIEHAEHEGAFAESAISARFDSAYGSCTDLPSQVDASDRWKKNAVTEAKQRQHTSAEDSPHQETNTKPDSPERGRLRVRDANKSSVDEADSPPPTRHSQRPRLGKKRSSIWDSVRSRSSSTLGLGLASSRTEDGTGRRRSILPDVDLPSLTNVAGRTLQRSSVMMI